MEKHCTRFKLPKYLLLYEQFPVTMVGKPDLVSLKKDALKKLVIHNNRFYFTDNHEELPVFEGIGKARNLWSEETYRYPFYAAYEGNKLKFVFAHVVADATTIYLFYDFIMNTYLRDRYPGEFEFDEVAKFEASGLKDYIEPMDLIGDKLSDSTKSEKRVVAYYLNPCAPEERDLRVYINMPVESVLKITKSWDVTPAALFSTIFTTALKNAYKLDSENVVACVLADLRRRTGIMALRNFFSTILLPVNTSELTSDIEAESKAAGEKLDRIRVGGMETALKLITSIPGNVETKIAAAKKMIGDSGKNMLTYSISYFRMQDPSDWYTSKAKALTYSVFPSSISSPYIVITSRGGTMKWDISGLPDRDKILPEVSKLLADLGIDTEIYEERDECKDVLDLKLIETV